MSLDQEIDSRKLALSGLNSLQLADRLKRSGELLDALATQKLLSEKEAYKRDLAMQMEQSPKTIAQKNEELLKQQSQMDVAQGVAGVLQNRKRRSDANAKMLAGMDPRKLKAMSKRGIPGAPVQQRMNLAQGGIVGFQEGMGVNLLPMVADSSETFVDALGKDEASMEVINQVIDYVKENPAEATILAGSTAFLGPTGAAVSTTAKGLAATLGKSFKPLLNSIIRGVTKPKKLPSGRLSSVKRSPSLTQAVTKGLPAAAVAGVAAKEFGPPILEGIQSLGSKAGLPFFPKEPEMGQVDASPAVAPTVELESVRDAQRMMDINEIPAAPDAAPTAVAKDPTELFAQIDPKGERTKKKERPPIPTVTGDESQSELNQKDEQLNSGLSRLASILSIYARSDPRKPGGFTAAVDEYDQKLIDEKRKTQAMRLKERELEISSRLADIRASGIESQFLLNRLKELDNNILSARETVREGSAATLLGLESKLTSLLKEKETFMGGLTSGFIGRSEEEINADIETVRKDIAYQKDLMEIAVNEMAGDFIAERNALKKKYTNIYENYTETREDFNLKDQRTVGQ